MPRSRSTYRPLVATAILGIALLVMGPAAAQPAADRPHSTVPTAADHLMEDPRFTTFVAIVERSGRMPLLRHRDLVTVFAPTEEAFGALPEKTVRALREGADLARAFVDLHLIDHDLIHEEGGRLVANGAVNPVDRVVALPAALRDE